MGQTINIQVQVEYIFPKNGFFRGNDYIRTAVITIAIAIKLHSAITTVQTLAPNDVTSARWQYLYPGCFGFFFTQWEETEINHNAQKINAESFVSVPLLYHSYNHHLFVNLAFKSKCIYESQTICVDPFETVVPCVSHN